MQYGQILAAFTHYGLIYPINLQLYMTAQTE